MEAAGIEPASGSLPPFDPTCVVRGLALAPQGSHGRDPLGPILGSSRRPGSRPPEQPARILTALPRPTSRGREDRALSCFRQPARAQRCRWLLSLLPAVLRVA